MILMLINKVKQTILEELEGQACVPITTDLWSDRRCSFLGVTAHVYCKSKCNQLKQLTAVLVAPFSEATWTHSLALVGLMWT